MGFMEWNHELMNFFRLVRRVEALLRYLNELQKENKRLTNELEKIKTGATEQQGQDRIHELEEEVKQLRKENQLLKEREQLIKNKVERLAVKLEELEL